MKLYLIVATLILSVAASAQTAELRRKTFNLSPSGIAIDGYDPVAYFSANKAVKGKKEINGLYNGVLYYFATLKNKELFKADPEKYEPQYGGWCAYAMGATGEKVEIDPDTFKIVDGRLYLFYNKFFNNTLKTWNKDESRLKSHADKNWEKLTH